MDTEQKVDKLYLDMYLGSGKENPSVSTRLDRVEQVIENMTTNHNQIKWALYAALFLLLANLIGAHVKF